MAEAQLERKRQILFKKEGTSLTPETLTAAEGKMRVAVKPEATPQGQRNARDVARATMTRLPGIPGAKASSIKWRCEAVGSGSVTVPPAENDALECAGLARTTVHKVAIGAITLGTFLRGDSCTATGGRVGRLLIDAVQTPGFLFLVSTGTAFASADEITNGVAVATASAAQAAAGYSYRFISSGQPTGTCRDEEDGYQKSIFGAAVTAKLTMEANKQGFWEFEAKGPDLSYGDQTMTPGITPFTTLPPILQNALMRLDSYAAVLKSYMVDLGNTLALRDDGNAAGGLKGCRIADRRPVGSCGIEMMNESDFDIYNKFLDGADVKTQCRLGSAPGNSIWVFGDRANFSGIAESGADGIVVVTPEFELNGFEGEEDDELEILYL